MNIKNIWNHHLATVQSKMFKWHTLHQTKVGKKTPRDLYKPPCFFNNVDIECMYNKKITQQNRPTYLLYIKLCINHLKIQQKQKKHPFGTICTWIVPKTTGVLTGNTSFFSFLLVDFWHDTLFASICTAHMVRAARPTNTAKPEAENFSWERSEIPLEKQYCWWTKSCTSWGG